MKTNTTTLTFIIYAVLLSSAAVLLNDLREFDLEQYRSFENWAATAEKGGGWFTSENAIRWSYYAISAGLFFLRGYLIYGFTYFIPILRAVEKGEYFSEKNIRYFKKIGDIFIIYTINALVLRSLLAAIGKSTFDLFHIFKEEFTFLIPCGLACYLLAEIFKRAKAIHEENELTI